MRRCGGGSHRTGWAPGSLYRQMKTQTPAWMLGRFLPDCPLSLPPPWVGHSVAVCHTKPDPDSCPSSSKSPLTPYLMAWCSCTCRKHPKSIGTTPLSVGTSKCGHHSLQVLSFPWTSHQEHPFSRGTPSYGAPPLLWTPPPFLSEGISSPKASSLHGHPLSKGTPFVWSNHSLALGTSLCSFYGARAFSPPPPHCLLHSLIPAPTGAVGQRDSMHPKCSWG